MIKCSKKGVSLVANELVNTTRVFKISTKLVDRGVIGNLKIIGFWKIGLSSRECFTCNIELIRKRTLKSYLPCISSGLISKFFTLISVIPLGFSLFFSCISSRPRVIFCHDVILLPIALLVKLFNNAEIYYLPHELESEETGNSIFLKYIFVMIERVGLKFVKHTIVVSPGIKDWYINKYGLTNVAVIRNIPEVSKNISEKKILRSMLNIAKRDLVFIYQGLLDRSRGVLEIASVFKEVEFSKHIVFMGFGPEYNLLLSLSKRYPNIHCLPAVEINLMKNYTGDADIGIVFIPGQLSMSYALSLPNKFFEYILNGIPVLISDNLTTMKKEIETCKIGFISDSSKEGLRYILGNLDKVQLSELKDNIDLMNIKYNWEREFNNSCEVWI
jgi:glycosyltransferase involved in cell wall biosynthesis